MPRALLLLLVGLSGCSSLGPTAGSPCYVQPSRFMADDQNPIARMVVMNVGKPCGVSLSIDQRVPERTGEVVSQPGHGVAMVRRLSGVMYAVYTPEVGFEGQDSFKARLGGGSQVMTVDVTVRPPRT